MSIQKLQEIEDDYDFTLEEQSEIEDKVQEEIDSMLEDLSKDDIREQLDELDDPEFRELVENILDQKDSKERMEKTSLLHVLHVDDQKVKCIQEEWLGDLEVKPTEQFAKSS